MDAFKNFTRRVVAVALRFEARLLLRKYNPKIIAITGNVGKTSTKDAIYTVLSATRYVRKSEKSFNTEIGIPLAILGCHNPWWNVFRWVRVFVRGALLILFRQSYPAWLVLEVGADRPGDIRSITTWLKPHIVVVTRFAEVPAHIEYFSSREALIDEKRHLVRALRENGLLIVNRDDADSYGMHSLFSGQTLSYGFSEGASIHADYYAPIIQEKTARPLGITFKVAYDHHSVSVKLAGALGFGQAYAVLPALAIGTANNISLDRIVRALEAHTSPPGRMRILDGVKNTTIIDDSYNSSPVAVDNALDALRELPLRGRKIVVLGDMLELGKMSAEAHKRVGRRVAEVADMLVVVGVRARGIVEGALDYGMDEKVITQFDTAEEAGEQVKLSLQEGDVVLVKGSQLMRMERTVVCLMAHPELNETLLVRQDSEWLKR